MSSAQELSPTLCNIDYTEGDSLDVICGNVQTRYRFLKRLKILGDLTSSEFAQILSTFQNIPVIGTDTETGRTYVFTFRRQPGNVGVNVECKIAANGTSQTNIATGVRAAAERNKMVGPRVEYNLSETGANQTNSAAGVGASASHNQARDKETIQTNKASLCRIL